MKKLSYICKILTMVLSHIMVAVVSYNYRGMQCGIEHLGFSAPAEVALFSIIPFILVITILMVLSWYFTKRSCKKEKNRDAKISS